MRRKSMMTEETKSETERDTSGGFTNNLNLFVFDFNWSYSPLTGFSHKLWLEIAPTSSNT